ncbi:PREDICTED: fucolectin-like isoform X3 [Branchiostoma belcheri]|uniref:Fucolectin-like isoform X3 n=1 Tax=Branchiostoma belcheri TaxID=7741 RepID=A0A6P4YVP7_BRABE|nr:PREDICTED: fucolectin-like isoform X3 [Branchiostoma belcheri]
MAGALTFFAILLLLGHSAEANKCAGGITNIGLNRPATQSSTYQGAVAGRAVDDNVVPRWDRGTCTHTKSQTNPWWRVDLGSSQCVDKVGIKNRQDCCWERLQGFKVHVGDNPDVLKNPTCGGANYAGAEMMIVCDGLTGRYVGISLTGSSRILTLCDVRVWGDVKNRKRGYYEALPGTGAQGNDLENAAFEEEALEKKAWEEEALEEEVLEEIEALEVALEMEK